MSEHGATLVRPSGSRVVDLARSSGMRLLAVSFRPASLALVGLIVGMALPLAWLTGAPSVCPFKVVTGLPCPGCGLTRSAVAFLHGDLSTSLYYHPLGAPIVIAVVIFGFVDAWFWWRGRRPGGAVSSASWLLDWLAKSPAPWVAIGALALVWLVRLPLYVVGAWTF